MSGQSNGGGTHRPRAAAIIGPYGSGKSTLFEALMLTGGAQIKRGDPRSRRMGTELRLGHCSFLGDSWSLIDCPGSVEFAFETAAALSAVDIAVVVVEPVAAKAMLAAPLLKQLDDRGIPHIVFINKIETLEGRAQTVLDALQGHSRVPLVLRQVPIRDGAKITGYVDVVSERAYRYRKGQESELIALPGDMQAREQEVRGVLLERLADHNDALLEKLIEEVAPSTHEIYAQLRADLANDAVVEVLLGNAETDNGIQRLWKALRHDTPLAEATAARRGIPAGAEPLAQVVRSVHAGHTGKLSIARIWRGTVKDGVTLGGSRLGGIYRYPGGESAKMLQAEAGEVVALGRLDGVATGATVSTGPMESLPFPAPPPPVYALAIATGDRHDDVKLSGALHKLIEEDLALSVTSNADLAQTVLHGQGEMHLNAAIERLAKAHNLRVTTAPPKVAYRETIRRAVHQHGRLKRQTGGHGQFADIKIDIAPRARGEGFLFVDKIVGGTVPRNYIPAVGEAAEEATRKGPLGHPVVDVSVTLVDGSYHAVDSSDMAFKSATRAAMAEGLAAAEPLLLEPFDQVTVRVPSEFTPRAQRLLSGRRGQILGFTAAEGTPGWDDVEALVPQAELHDFIIELRSQTMGLGSYRRQFDHLAESRSGPGR
ncbi:MAG: elongation factor G [Alphaproteobacteria bacterium]|nr:elongation factor G [Alphaproteobacteria bacterium]